jgi:heme exporter protein A
MAGDVVWDGADEDESVQSQLHYLGHLDALKPSMSVRETLSFWAEMMGGRSGIDAAIEAWHLGMLAALPCGVLSAGQRRRVALAQLDLTDRPLWLLDEPTGPLDQAGVDLVAAAVKRHCGNGGTALIATHRSLDVGEVQVLDLGPGGRGA